MASESKCTKGTGFHDLNAGVLLRNRASGCLGKRLLTRSERSSRLKFLVLSEILACF